MKRNMRERHGALSLMLDLLTLVALLLVLGSFARRELLDRRAPPSATAGQPPSSLVGAMLPRLEAVNATGADAPIDVATSGVPHVLLVFRSDCPACAQQRAGWLELAEAAQARGIAVLGITGEPLLEGVAGYLGDADVEVRRALRPQQLAALGVRVVPTTIVVEANGVIVDAVAGVRDDVQEVLEGVGKTSGR